MVPTGTCGTNQKEPQLSRSLSRDIVKIRYNYIRTEVNHVLSSFILRAIHTIDRQGDMWSCQVKDSEYYWSCRGNIFVFKM